MRVCVCCLLLLARTADAGGFWSLFKVDKKEQSTSKASQTSLPKLTEPISAVGQTAFGTRQGKKELLVDNPSSSPVAQSAAPTPSPTPIPSPSPTTVPTLVPIKKKRQKHAQRKTRAKRHEHAQNSKILNLFTKVEAGCCDSTGKTQVLFDDSIGSPHDSAHDVLVMCLKKCAELPTNAGSADACGYVTYGWYGSNRCRITSKSSSCDSISTKFCDGLAAETDPHVSTFPHVYAPTAFTKTRADKACGVASLQEWLSYLILNKGGYCWIAQSICYADLLIHLDSKM